MELVELNHVVADDFEVQIISRDELMYKDLKNNKYVIIFREPCYDPELKTHYAAIVINSLEKWTFPSGGIISEDELNKIKENITLAFQLMNGRYRFE